MSYWPKYVTVAERRAKAKRQMEKLRKTGKKIQPVEIEGRTIARSFWGKAWCKHLESYSDYENRLPRGRTYVRNGSVCHLEVKPGCIKAIVSGSSLYKLNIKIEKLESSIWDSIKKKSTGQIGSILELLQGKLSNEVMAIVTERQNGLFPQLDEMEFKCNCPDWAVMCKHVAAALYGIGRRLDERPDLLFLLRDVDPEELISAEIAFPEADVSVADAALSDDQVAGIFGIDLDAESPPEKRPVAKTKPKKPTKAIGHSADLHNQKKSTAEKSRKTSHTHRTEKKRRKNIITITPPKIRPTGKSVTRLRKQLGFSITQFARKLDVSTASIYKWEATDGRLTLRASSLRALAHLSQQAKVMKHRSRT